MPLQETSIQKETPGQLLQSTLSNLTLMEPQRATREEQAMGEFSEIKQECHF